MIIGDRLRALREERKLSQGAIEKRTGLKRCYISRVEHGHTVPSLETIEKFALALELPLYRLFYDGEGAPAPPNFPKRGEAGGIAWGNPGEEARIVGRFTVLLARMGESDRQFLLYIARRMASRSRSGELATA